MRRQILHKRLRQPGRIGMIEFQGTDGLMVAGISVKHRTGILCLVHGLPETESGSGVLAAFKKLQAIPVGRFGTR